MGQCTGPYVTSCGCVSVRAVIYPLTRGIKSIPLISLDLLLLTVDVFVLEAYDLHQESESECERCRKRP